MGAGAVKFGSGALYGSSRATPSCCLRKLAARLVPDPDDPGQWEFDGIPHYTAKFDMSRDGIMRALEASLERHHLSYIDILYLHDPDWENLEDEALETAFPTMLELKEQGVVKAIGTGMNQWEMPARFMQEVHLDIVLLAGRYTLLDQCALDEFLPLCERTGTMIATGGPYNSGILASADLDGPVWFNYQPAEQHWIEKAKSLAAVAKRHNVDLKAAALQFPLAHPSVACVIPGSASPAQTHENAALIRAEIPADFWAELRYEKLIPEQAPIP